MYSRNQHNIVNQLYSNKIKKARLESQTEAKKKKNQHKRNSASHELRWKKRSWVGQGGGAVLRFSQQRSTSQCVWHEMRTRFTSWYWFQFGCSQNMRSLTSSLGITWRGILIKWKTCRHRATRMNLAAGNHGNQEWWEEGGVLSLRKTRARLNGFRTYLRTVKHVGAGSHMS